MMRLLILTLFFLISNYAMSANDSPRVVKLVYEVKPNPPYYLGLGTEIDWRKPGITLEVLQIVENRLGIRFEFVRRPWARALAELEANQLEGLFHASYKPERERLGVYPMLDGKVDKSRKAMVQSYYLYTRRNSKVSWDGTRINNMQGAVGAILGYSIVNDLKALGHTVEEVPTQLSNLAKLAAGRIEALAGIGAMNDFQIRKNLDRFGDIIKHVPPIKSKAYYLIFSHQFAAEHPKLINDIWDEMTVIQASDSYQALLLKYLNDD